MTHQETCKADESCFVYYLIDKIREHPMLLNLSPINFFFSLVYENCRTSGVAFLAWDRTWEQQPSTSPASFERNISFLI